MPMRRFVSGVVVCLGFAAWAQAGAGSSTDAVGGDDQIFIFPFFRDNGQHGVYLAWSEDGLHFKPLNNDRPVMSPAAWPGQNLTRDPSIVHHDGLFRMVWTSNWGGRVFGVAESPDLKAWSEPRPVTPFPASLPDDQQPRNVWAPEICWNPFDEHYFIVWSSTRAGQDGHRMFVTRSPDLRTFSAAELFYDPGFNSIDGMMVLDRQGLESSADGRWVMVFKDEREIPQGGKNLRLTTAPADGSRPWAPSSEPIAGPHSELRPHEMGEGPSLLKRGDTWYLYWDAFASGHYSLATSTDLETWTDRTDELTMPPGHPRHGTVFLVPRAAVAEELF
jgi:beta-xylosidase